MTAYESYPIDDRCDFKAWALIHPSAHTPLRKIIDQWRASNVTVRESLANETCIRACIGWAKLAYH